MGLEIGVYDNREHRAQVIDLWTRVFGYEDSRNDPALVIDKKLAARDGLFFVAVENDQVVGTIMAGYDGHRGWIYLMAVTPESRKKRIGTRILEHAEAELRKLGCVKINLQIFQHNESVMEFYLRNGYSIEERTSMGKEITENVR